MKTNDGLIRIKVKPRYKVIDILWMENGCCPDLPVLLTANWIKDEGRINYSCQCACGCWCTTGCRTPEEAIDHYQDMTDGFNLYGGFMHYVI